jgi:cytochrome c5
VSDHDQHSSFIKTPQQLIAIILAAFLVPIIGIILLVQLVTVHRSGDSNALTPESIAARIQPVGKVEIGAPAPAAGARSGEEIVKATCGTCHTAGVAGAPKIGDKAAWAPRIKQGLDGMLKAAIGGIKAMPPRGGDASLTDDELARAIVFMANQSGAKLKEPAAPAKQAATATAPQEKPAAADGKALYEKVCSVCHAAGVAGAPKLGDKAAWAPRLKQGTDALVQSVIKGKGAMPPKAGNPGLSEGEIRAAVEFLAAQAK